MPLIVLRQKVSPQPCSRRRHCQQVFIELGAWNMLDHLSPCGRGRPPELSVAKRWRPGEGFKPQAPVFVPPLTPTLSRKGRGSPPSSLRFRAKQQSALRRPSSITMIPAMNIVAWGRTRPMGRAATGRARPRHGACLRACPAKVGTGFAKRTCSNKRIERDDDRRNVIPALIEIFTDDFLRTQLRSRGGTALNKLHLRRSGSSI
jgi:hypothetical protein